MQRRLVNKSDSDMAVFSRCEDLISHTLLITNNTKHFPKHMRFTLVNRMQDKVLDMYESLMRANEIFPESDELRERRRTLQRLVLVYCKEVLFFIELSLEQGYISYKSAEYWAELVVHVKNLTGKWLQSDIKRFG